MLCNACIAVDDIASVHKVSSNGQLLRSIGVSSEEGEVVHTPRHQREGALNFATRPLRRKSLLTIDVDYALVLVLKCMRSFSPSINV